MPRNHCKAKGSPQKTKTFHQGQGFSTRQWFGMKLCNPQTITLIYIIYIRRLFQSIPRVDLFAIKCCLPATHIWCQAGLHWHMLPGNAGKVCVSKPCQASMMLPHHESLWWVKRCRPPPKTIKDNRFNSKSDKGKGNNYILTKPHLDLGWVMFITPSLATLLCSKRALNSRICTQMSVPENSGLVSYLQVNHWKEIRSGSLILTHSYSQTKAQPLLKYIVVWLAERPRPRPKQHKTVTMQKLDSMQHVLLPFMKTTSEF